MSEGRKFKVENVAFEAIEAKITERDTALEAMKKASKEVWETIYALVPGVTRDDRWSLDTDYEELGFYVVKESKEDPFIRAIKRSLGDDD